MRKSGLLKWKFPVKPDHEVYVDLATWRTDAPPFFFHSGNDIKKPDLRKEALLQLKDQAEHVLRGDILFFGGTWYELSNAYNWITNPDTGYIYDKNLHWTQVQDFFTGSRRYQVCMGKIKVCLSLYHHPL